LDQACEEMDLKGKELQHKNLLGLEPFALQVLHELVSLVHDRVNGPVQSTFINDSAARVKGECKEVATANLFHLDDDPVAKILSTLEPSTLQHVFLAMAVSLYSLIKLVVLKGHWILY
jgi:hypothetical protein